MAVLSDKEIESKIQTFRVIKELYQTEKTFHDGLEKGLSHYKPHWRKAFPGQSDLFEDAFTSSIQASSALLGKLEKENIHQINIERLKELAHTNPKQFLQEHDKALKGVVSAFEHFETHRQALQVGVNYYEILNNLSQTSEAIQKAQVPPISSLQSYLIMPAQRGPRFKLLLEQMDKSSASSLGIKECLDSVSKEIEILNKRKGEFDAKYGKAIESVSKMLEGRTGLAQVRQSARQTLGLTKSKTREKIKNEIIGRLASVFLEVETREPKSYVPFVKAIEEAKQVLKASPNFNPDESSLWKNLVKLEDQYRGIQADLEKGRALAQSIRDLEAAKTAKIEPIKSTAKPVELKRRVVLPINPVISSKPKSKPVEPVTFGYDAKLKSSLSSIPPPPPRKPKSAIPPPPPRPKSGK